MLSQKRQGSSMFTCLPEYELDLQIDFNFLLFHNVNSKRKVLFFGYSLAETKRRHFVQKNKSNIPRGIQARDINTDHAHKYNTAACLVSHSKLLQHGQFVLM